MYMAQVLEVRICLRTAWGWIWSETRSHSGSIHGYAWFLGSDHPKDPPERLAVSCRTACGSADLGAASHRRKGSVEGSAHRRCTGPDYEVPSNKDLDAKVPRTTDKVRRTTAKVPRTKEICWPFPSKSLSNFST